MTKPHSACWIIAATAMVVLLSPSPAGVASNEPAGSGRLAVEPCSDTADPATGPWAVERMLVPYPVEIAPHQLAAFAPRPAEPLRAVAAAVDPALGPWAIERMLCPYPATVALEALPELSPKREIPAATSIAQLPGPVDSALGPWRVEQFVCPYQITVAPKRLREAARRAARPLPAPTTIDSALGPWPIERLLSPYPAAVAPQRLPEFSAWGMESLRPAASSVPTKPARNRLVLRVAGTTRKLLGLVERGARAARKALQDFSEPMTPTLGGEAAMPGGGGQAVPTQTSDAAEGRQQSIGTLDASAPRPASWLHDDGEDFLLPWREAPQTASDPFALKRRWTGAADELTLAPEVIMPPGDPSQPRPVAGLDRIFPQSTGIAFLAALLLVPASCSYAAGAVYGYARDGPPPQP
ncbi:MAG: hypothetical protein ACYSWT_07730 [Planctomycetota bacterium]|jgi:hypothetical protein